MTDSSRIDFDTEQESEYWMASGEMMVGFNMPAALTEKPGGCGLPPYRRRKYFLVDEYPGCPNEWPRSEGSQISYFVPVKRGHGMWLDFNECTKSVHDVAIVISIQGVNAITGLPSEDVCLEQYREECPRHKVKFGPRRFCEQCGYRWPKQNYISTTATPDGQLWLDGFRSGDGTVRQYLLTEERLRGIANAIVGERRVHSIGISFFLSKTKKPVTVMPNNTRLGGMGDKFMFHHTVFEGYKEYPGPECLNDLMYYGDNKGGWKGWMSGTTQGTIGTSCSPSSPSINLCRSADAAAAKFCQTVKPVPVESSSISEALEMGDCHIADGAEGGGLLQFKDDDQVQPVTAAVKLEVGAGAVIRQIVHEDTNDLDFWREKPETVVIINYAEEEVVGKIISGSKKDVTGSKEGFLAGLPKGNDIKGEAK